MEGTWPCGQWKSQRENACEHSQSHPGGRRVCCCGPLRLRMQPEEETSNCGADSEYRESAAEPPKHGGGPGGAAP